jgi:UDP-N-acetyl-D-glucosamine dehydrogenase
MPAQDVLVIGLGYVGLPLAVQAARAGFRVTGYDTSAEIAASLNAGRSHVDDVSGEEVEAARVRGFRAAADEAGIGPQDMIVIYVPTPLSEADGPDLGAVRAAAEAAGRLVRPGMLVSLESTTYPGTTDEVVRPLLEKTSGLTAGIDFSLVFSPERIDPGNPEYGLVNTPKIIGGVTPSCADAAAAFYGTLCEQVVRAVSAREAEMAKLLENTYRHVNIALVNEMAIFCRELGVDLHDAIRCAATKPFGFAPFYPGPGFGGYCIPIDPNYLSYKVRTLGYPFRFVELAQEINGRMPGYVTERAAELLNRNTKPVNGARAAARRDRQEGHRRPAGIPGPPDRPQAARPRCRGDLPRPLRAGLAGRRAGRLPRIRPAGRGGRRRPGHRAAGAPGLRPDPDRRRRAAPAGHPRRGAGAPSRRSPVIRDAGGGVHDRSSSRRRAHLPPAGPRPARRRARGQVHRSHRPAGF